MEPFTALALSAAIGAGTSALSGYLQKKEAEKERRRIARENAIRNLQSAILGVAPPAPAPMPVAPSTGRILAEGIGHSAAKLMESKANMEWWKEQQNKIQENAIARIAEEYRKRGANSGIWSLDDLRNRPFIGGGTELFIGDQ